MTIDFSKLKSQSTSGNLDLLSQKIKLLGASSEGADKTDNYWRPEVDKAGNGMAVIRFLPASSVDGDDALPWVKIFGHGFQGHLRQQQRYERRRTQHLARPRRR